MARDIGRTLNDELKLGAQHALYLKGGTWYHHLTRFPGVLFDIDGYVIFGTEHAYRNCPQLRHGKDLNVAGGISSIVGYVPDQRIKAIVHSFGI